MRERRNQNNESDAKQPRAQRIIERERKKIEAEWLAEDRIVSRRRRLMEIQRELPPTIFQLKAIDQPEERGHNPTERANESRRRKLKRLVVENNCAVLESVGAEESLKQKERRAQEQRSQDRRPGEQQNLGLEDVPVDRGIAERLKPKRGKIDRKNAR